MFAMNALRDVRGSALLEFAISLPLLVVFVVGIYDFSGAFNEKQKIEQAAQEGAIVAGSQPTSDIQASNGNPESLQAVVAAVFNSLANDRVLLPNANVGSCKPPGVATGPVRLAWTYKINGCTSVGSDQLEIIINRSRFFNTGTTYVIGTEVTVKFPYHWQINNVIQLVAPGATYLDAILKEHAIVHNQM